MSPGYRIAEVARRSGFPAATLRYYEGIGLLPEPARTAAGYRVYDDRTLDRLAFIARAKQLGCTLEEIAELSIAWDGGQCGPVQDRLRTLVGAKLADAQERMVELMTFTAELRTAAAALERHRPDGACDDRCGCTTAPSSTMTAVSRSTKPELLSDEPPIGCTLDAGSIPARLDEWNDLLGVVTARTAIPGGLRLEIHPELPVETVARLAGAEQECCRFLSFSVTIDGRGLGLEVRAPDDARPLVDAVFGVPA